MKLSFEDCGNMAKILCYDVSAYCCYMSWQHMCIATRPKHVFHWCGTSILNIQLKRTPQINCNLLRRDVLYPATLINSVLAECVRNASWRPLPLMLLQMGSLNVWRSLHFPLTEGEATAATNTPSHSTGTRLGLWIAAGGKGGIKEKRSMEVGGGDKGWMVSGRNNKWLSHHLSSVFYCSSLQSTSFFLICSFWLAII